MRFTIANEVTKQRVIQVASRIRKPPPRNLCGDEKQDLRREKVDLLLSLPERARNPVLLFIPQGREW